MPNKLLSFARDVRLKFDCFSNCCCFSDTSCDMPHFSYDLLVSQHAHVEKLTFSYYLRHGRPSFAFVSFVGEKLKDATVSKAK